ncbi:hypothetical protein QZH41_012674 [Actinostola sp. cb2023]|nr:hypothetical protein QZH41_012674 [Actinostola sp. cb2023]
MTIKEIVDELSGSDGELSEAGDSECEGESAGDFFDPSQTPVAEQTLHETLNSSKKQKPKKKKKKWLSVCLTNCKYDSVRRVTKRFGMKEVGEEDDWSLFWTDTSVPLERCIDMKRYQLKYRTRCCLSYGELQTFCRQKKNKTYITKPETGSQGRGIAIIKNPKDIKPGEHMVCQQYISKPFLIDGFKFDLRVYVLVTSCDPLRVFLYEDGLGRFATIQYIEPQHNNLDDICMHLTNYSINKHSKDFIRDEESGSKRRLTTVNKWFEDHDYDVREIWGRIEDVIIKTLITAHPILKHNYRTCFPNHNKGSACFEILGFDILLDKKLKPWIIEVNLSPSFSTDSLLDKEIKEGLMQDALNLVNFGACDRKKIIEEDRKRVRDRLLQKQRPKEPKRDEDEESQSQYNELLTKYEDKNLGKYRRIYPQGNEEKYQKFFENSCSLFQETAASKARIECARMQREQIQAKQELDIAKQKNKSRGARPESPHGGRSSSKKPPIRRPYLGRKKTEQDDKDSQKGESLANRVIASLHATSAVTTVGSASTQSNPGRIPYQIGQLSNAVNVNSLHQQHQAVLSRNDRRSLGALGMAQGVPKHRLGPRRAIPKAYNVIGTDVEWRSNANFEDSRMYGLGQFYEARGESHPNSGSKHRTFSASGPKSLQDSPNAARVNPRVAGLMNSTFAGSQSNLSSSEGATPFHVSQHYACSAYPFPNVTKVTPQQPTSLELSVISGPAPILQRSDGVAGDHGLPLRKHSNSLANHGR